jgi:hypothetical protein
MARIFIDGFEGGDVSFWTAENTAEINSSRAGRTGAYCTHVGFGRLKFTLPTAKSELYAAFRYSPAAFNDYSGTVFQFMSGTTKLGVIRQAGERKLQAYRGDGDALLGTATTTLATDGTWYLIEVHYVPHVTSGTFQIKINGILEVDVSGVQTAPSTTSINGVWLHDQNFSIDSYFDDFILDDAAWIGNSKIQKISPSGAGNSTQWTPSTGDNYACVDEIPASDADYVSSNTTGHLDLFAAENLSGTIGIIKCVQMQARAKYEGAPTPTHVQLALRSGGTDYFSADKTPGGSFSNIGNIWETDPATAAAWTESGVNAMEIGIKATA